MTRGGPGALVPRRPGGAAGVADLPDPWGGEPYLAMSHGRAHVLQVWTSDAAVLVHLEDDARPAGLTGVGDVAGVARQLERAVEEGGVPEGEVQEGEVPAGAPRWATVPRGTWDALGGDARAAFAGWSAPSAWDCMWTERPLTGVRPHPVERLPAGDPAVGEEIAEALARAHPEASTRPDDPRLLGWWVAREAGRIVALVGALRLGSGLAPHLASLGVDPGHRGRGLAGAVLAAAVDDGLAEPVAVGPRAVWLGLYATNDVARRVYLRHGFVLGHELESRGRRPR